MLRSFQDLVRILTLHPAKYDAIYFPRKTVASDYDKLFDIIRKGNHTTDEEVSAELYGTTDNKATTRYFTLKSRLKDRLENGFFFLSSEQFSTRNARRYAAWKEQMIIWVLWSSGAKETAVQRMEKLVEEAEMFGWNDVLVPLYRHIRQYYAHQGSMVLFRKFDTLLQEARNRETAEIEAETALAELEIFKARETLLGREYEEQCKTLVARIDEIHKGIVEKSIVEKSIVQKSIAESSGAYRLTQYASQASQFLAEAKGDYAQVLRVFSEQERAMQQFPHGLEAEERSLLDAAKLPFFLLAKDIEGSKQAVESILAYNLPEMLEIPAVYAYYFLTAMHTRSFVSAGAIFEAVLQTQAMKRFADVHTSHWRVFEVYARLFLREEIPQRPTLFKPRFSWNKFLAEIPDYGEKQSALNAAWILAQMLHLMNDADWEGIAKRNNDLLLYHDKYLRKDTPQYRLQCFLRMVNQAVLCNFEVQETLRKTHKYCIWLTEARKYDILKTGFIEVIPLEFVWSLLLFRMKHSSEKTLTPFKTILDTFPDPLQFYRQRE